MEPSVTSAAGLTITIGTVSVVGTLLGMQYDSLLFGLFGGLIFLTHSKRSTRASAISNVITSVLLAGALSPVACGLAVAWFESLEKVGEDNIRRALAMCIGAGWQGGIPVLVSALKSKLGISGN